MKELAKWLMSVERLAGDFYDGAARAFGNDDELAAFLKHLAADEAWHYRVMESAVEYLEGNTIDAAIALDAVTREKIEAPFLDCANKLKSAALTREHIVHCIVSTEFSEWNDIFVYVVNTLKEAGREFAYTASQMEAHKRFIEKTIEALPKGGAYLETMRRLPRVWHTQILIVEDHPGVLEFLNTILSVEAAVETAINGSEGLDKVRRKFFDVVLSDIDMPVMNGIEFYKAALQLDPRIGERFLFLTGYLSDETAAFIQERRVRYLTKPMRIREIEETVHAIRDKLPLRRG